MSFSLSDEALRTNPYPTLSNLRSKSEPTRLGDDPDSNTYLFTRYDDVKAILTDSRFINDRRKLPGAEDWTTKWYIPDTLKLFANSMALMDDPDHARLKRLVHKAFTPRRIRELADGIELMANNLLDAVADQDKIP